MSGHYAFPPRRQLRRWLCVLPMVLFPGVLAAQALDGEGARVSTLAAELGSATARVTVSGGGHAGTHALTTDARCKWRRGSTSTSRLDFDARVSAWEKDRRGWGRNAMTVVWIEVRRYETGRAAAQLFLSVGFGETGLDQYVVRTDRSGPPLGQGSVTITERGDDAIATFDAITREGIRLQGTVTCHAVEKD
ncbi:MAG TPA: hypothetical protein VFY20_14595 [Gemmatimonadales bacterium]|nr:hypothetical protein [Gemmatimonadales bacterium]